MTNMKKINWDVIFTTFGILTIVFLNLVILNQRQEITTLNTNQALVDSMLKNDFEKNIDYCRLRNAVEIFREEQPESAAKLDSILSKSE